MKLIRSEICSTSWVLCRENRILRPSSAMTPVNSRRISWREAGRGLVKHQHLDLRDSTSSNADLTRWPWEMPLIFWSAPSPKRFSTPEDEPGTAFEEVNWIG